MRQSPATPHLPDAAVRPRLGACIHTARSVAQADVFELDWDGSPALLKDFSARPWLVRVCWSRLIAAREVRVLRLLEGLAGVPRLYATVGREGFIMERLDASRLPQRREPPPPPEFWRDARTLLDRLHASGISHGDLRRKNIMIGPRHEPYLIDFATAIIRRRAGGGLGDWLFRHMRLVDRVTFARIKASYPNTALDEEERRWLASEPWFLRIGRFFKKNVYRLRKPKTWRKQFKKTKRTVRHTLHGGPPAKGPS